MQNKKAAVMTSVALGSALLLLFLGVASVHQVGPGHVGVVTHWGAVQPETLPEGVHTMLPGKTRIHDIDVRIRKMEASAGASSRDLQVVNSRVVLNYVVDQDQAALVFQRLGVDYENTVIAPSVQESVKAATARFTAEELITKRPLVKQGIFEDLIERLGREHILVSDFSIVDFKFGAAFNKAIEDKQVAEQKALRAKNDLDRIRIEAQQEEVQATARALAREIEAGAEANANRLLGQDLTADVLTLRATEKWDGRLPQVSGGGQGLFVDLGVVTQ